jgi:hypothetical protein
MKMVGDSSETRRFLEDMTWCWAQLTIPEALTCEYENHGVTLDNPGRKPAFCAKAWLAGFYRMTAGLTLSCEGLFFAASDTGDIQLNDLKIRNHLVGIKITGKGGSISSLTLNGCAIPAPFKIPFARLAERNEIIIQRGG